MAKTNSKTTIAAKIDKPTAAQKIITVFGERSLWHIIVLVLLPFFIFIKITGFEFINMDDVAIIQNNFHILGSIKNIGIAFKTDAFLSAHGDFYRPVQTVSFMIDALIGKENPWIYHFSGLIYHLLTVIALYYLLIFLGIKKMVSFIFSLLFSLHPVLAAAISWVPARGDVLIGLFGILMLITFAKYIRSGKWHFFALHALLFLTAAFTKETTLVFPLMLLFYYFLIAKEKFSLKKLLPFFLLWITVSIVFLYMRSKVVSGTPPDFIFGLKPLLLNLPTIPIILAKFFLPANLSTMPLFENSFTIIGCIILLLMGLMVYKKIRSKEWLPLFGFSWFLLFIAPPLLFKLFFSKYLLEYYEHRAYLPFIGVIILLSYLFNEILSKSKTGNIIWLPVVAIVLFTPIASIHSDHFKNTMQFFGRAAELNNPGASIKIAEEYINAHDIVSASAEIEKGIENSNGEYPPAFFSRGIIDLTYEKKYFDADADFSTTLALDSTFFQAYIKRAEARIQTQNIGGAFDDLNKAKQFVPNDPTIFYTEGKVFVASQQPEPALVSFSKAIKLDSNYTEAYNDRAFVNYRLKKFDDALADCDKAIARNQLFLNAYYNKGMILYEKGLSDSAIKQFDITLNLANNFYFGYFYRGMAKLQKKDMTGACNDWQESVKLGFDMAQDTIQKYCR
ncbi:hypothetical protein ACQ33O_00010 [Ferruginibacter sp. SUN002]|uniref:hypothetical protein n=1 Tax=Ferruginibacter sp. SUN002 TaxID=2937789 RepID=UPI003D35DD51